MKTVFTFFMILTSISILLYLGGVTEANDWSITQLVLNLIQGNNVKTSTLGILVFTTLTLALATAVGVNIITGGSSSAGITVVKAGAFMFFIPAYVGDYLNMIKLFPLTETSSQIDVLAHWFMFIVGGLLLVGFLWSLIEYLFEND